MYSGLSSINTDCSGCKAEDVDISVYGNTLTISGEKKLSEEKKEKGYYHMESSYGSFRRELTLPTDVDQDKIDATCKDGVLSIKLTKAEKTKAVKVKVSWLVCQCWYWGLQSIQACERKLLEDF